MHIKNNLSLSQYSSMGLGGNAKYLANIANEDEALKAVQYAKDNHLNFIVIGGGSNIIFSDQGYDGLVIINNIKGIKDKGENTFEVGAGEDWDEFVNFSVNKNLSGIEALSAIPGKMGSAPYQNIGAYGQEIAETLVSVRALNTDSLKIEEISNVDCEFSYRNSIFKKNPGNYIITQITIKLHSDFMSPPFYDSLASYLTNHNITDYSPKSIRKLVTKIRREKLPDPKHIKNCGSFFINPIVKKEQFEKIKEQYSVLPYWENADGYKLSAAWLLDQCGFKDFHHPNGMATWKNQSLVVINEHAKKVSELIEFKNLLCDKVAKKFGVDLVMEPVIIGGH